MINTKLRDPLKLVFHNLKNLVKKKLQKCIFKYF